MTIPIDGDDTTAATISYTHSSGTTTNDDWIDPNVDYELMNNIDKLLLFYDNDYSKDSTEEKEEKMRKKANRLRGLGK